MPNRIFYGWWIVLATSLIHCLGAGTFFYSLTAFFNPIVEEFGWSYAATSFAASIRSLEGGIASPLIGIASDRFGARRLLFLGSVLSGLGFVLLSYVDSLVTFYILFLFLSVGASLLFPVPGWTVVTNWFHRKRGTAIGILSASIGLGGGLIYVVSFLISTYGWRSALVIIGISIWAIGIPSSLVVRHRPESYGLYPDGERPTRDEPRSTTIGAKDLALAAEEYSLGEAMKTKAFWTIALAITASASAVHAVMVHVMPYLISLNFSRHSASLVASFLVISSVAGRFGLGWLSNRMDNRYLLSLGVVLQSIGILFLAGATNLWLAVLFILFFGPGYGGVITLRLTLQAQYFGRRSFGAIQGSFMAITIIGTIVSPFLTGRCYDVYHDYRLAWFVFAALNLAILPLVLNIKPPRKEGSAHARPLPSA